MDWWWAYLSVGVFVGFFSGLLGIGGGSAMVPLLAFIFAAKGFAPAYVVHLALGTCIAAIMFTGEAQAGACSTCLGCPSPDDMDRERIQLSRIRSFTAGEFDLLACNGESTGIP